MLTTTPFHNPLLSKPLPPPVLLSEEERREGFKIHDEVLRRELGGDGLTPLERVYRIGLAQKYVRDQQIPLLLTGSAEEKAFFQRRYGRRRGKRAGRGRSTFYTYREMPRYLPAEWIEEGKDLVDEGTAALLVHQEPMPAQWILRLQWECLMDGAGKKEIERVILAVHDVITTWREGQEHPAAEQMRQLIDGARSGTPQDYLHEELGVVLKAIGSLGRHGAKMEKALAGVTAEEADAALAKLREEAAPVLDWLQHLLGQGRRYPREVGPDGEEQSPESGLQKQTQQRPVSGPPEQAQQSPASGRQDQQGTSSPAEDPPVAERPWYEAPVRAVVAHLTPEEVPRINELLTLTLSGRPSGPLLTFIRSTVMVRMTAVDPQVIDDLNIWMERAAHWDFETRFPYVYNFMNTARLPELAWHLDLLHEVDLPASCLKILEPAWAALPFDPPLPIPEGASEEETLKIQLFHKIDTALEGYEKWKERGGECSAELMGRAFCAALDLIEELKTIPVPDPDRSD